jgi:hypothetical protein
MNPWIIAIYCVCLLVIIVGIALILTFPEKEYDTEAKPIGYNGEKPIYPETEDSKDKITDRYWMIVGLMAGGIGMAFLTFVFNNDGKYYYPVF